MTGNQLLSTGGSGDALAGMIGALTAKSIGKKKSNENLIDTIRTAVFLHGAAADYSLQIEKKLSLKPSEITAAINDVYSNLMNRNEDAYFNLRQ